VIHRRLGLVGVTLLLSVACGHDEQVLATCSGRAITLGELDAFLLTLPERARQVEEGQSHEEWAEISLRRLAVQRVLMASEASRELAGSGEITALRDSSKAKMLVEKLMAQLSEAFPGERTEVAAIAGELAQRAETRTLFTFEHVFFRLDRSSSPGQARETRTVAATVAAEAQAGADFQELVRRHSESADADRGGLLANVATADLEEESARVLASLAEGEISPVVETRTGLHIFRLVRRLEVDPPPLEKLELMARQVALRRWLTEERSTLMEQLRDTVPVDIETSPWRVGSWTVGEEAVAQLSSDLGSAEHVRDAVVDQLLLAEEALERELWTPEMERAHENRIRVAIMERCFRELRKAHLDGLDEERIRPLFEAQPSRFAAPEAADVELIFVPQGQDSFQTQREVEAHVAALRAGASFAELARRISEGPSAEDGGHVGVVDRTSWGMWGQAVFEAIRSLEPGQVSEPVYCTDRVLTAAPSALKGGFAVVRVRERIPERQRTFEEAIDDVRRAYTSKNRKQIDKEVRRHLLDGEGFEIHRIPAAEEFRG